MDSILNLFLITKLLYLKKKAYRNVKLSIPNPKPVRQNPILPNLMTLKRTNLKKCLIKLRKSHMTFKELIRKLYLQSNEVKGKNNDFPK